VDLAGGFGAVGAFNGIVMMQPQRQRSRPPPASMILTGFQKIDRKFAYGLTGV